MITPETLRNELTAFDGKALTILGEIEARHNQEKGYRNALSTLASDPEPVIASGATWLIKHYLENGGSLTTYQIDQLLSSTPTMSDWMAQLHLCQSIKYLDLTKDEAVILIPWLDIMMCHQRPFLRAWALDALCYIARHHSAFLHNASVALATAKTDTAASVKARARNINLS